jgi:two-component system cell cycle response regulator DivK
VKSSILVVDDHELNLKLAREILTARGYEVVVAARGEEAVKVARDRRFALVLLDMQLPDMDGLEVLGRLRNLPETKHLTIVALTAQAMAGDRERFLAAGCDGYIQKPISLRTFSQQVEQYLARPGAGATSDERV